MIILNSHLKKQPIIYVTRDIERALGLNLDIQGYFIISNYSDFAKTLCENKNNILLIKNKKPLDTWELLENKEVKKFINKLKNKNILVFKNTPQIEKICLQNNWSLLNPSAELSNKVEEKISQLDWLQDLKKYLPNYAVSLVKDLKFKNKKFILQFNRSHTGSGTILIKNKKQLTEIQKKFPNRLARTADYIDGPMFTNNNIISKNNILIGNINYQITGLSPFTDLPFSTIGNDWGFANKYLTNKQKKKYHQIVLEIGEKLKKDGWKGLFGVDIAIDKKTKELFLIEINCRQPASTTYESQLQLQKRKINKPSLSYNYLTTFEAHLISLLNLNLQNYQLITITDGSQIIQRVTKEIPFLPIPQITKILDYHWLKYDNTKPNTDLLRIQAPYSIIKKHNELNKKGKEFINFVTATQANKLWDQPRGSVILIKNNKILLMERYKFGLHYFLIPGGTMEKNETILQTAIRETTEETGLKFEIKSTKPIKIINSKREEYYFWGKNISGKLKLGEEEKNRNTTNNTFQLVWKDLNELTKINLIPEKLKKYLIK